MKPKPEVGMEMLGLMLDSLDFPVYSFDKDRTVLHANKASRVVPGSRIGAAQDHHIEENEYFDIDGNQLPLPRNSMIERAFKGEETRDLILEHRNLKEHTHEWISVSCVPVMDNSGAFSYGIISYRDISLRKSREDKMQFLIDAMKVLSLTRDFRKRLREKAALSVPSLADWCSIEILDSDGGIERVALVHRDPKKIEWIQEYERKYPPPPGVESAAQRVIRTGKSEFVPQVTLEMIEQSTELTPAQRDDIKSLQLSSFMALPIGNQDNVLGTLTLAYAESGRVYSEEDLAFFGEYAHHLGVLLENARLDHELSERDVYKDLFLASLSHELRNPLAPIKTSLELLRLKKVDTETEAELKVIEHQFDHMARLLNDLLDSTRFMRGKITMNKETIDLQEVINYVSQAIAPVAKDAEVAITIKPQATPLIIEADRTRIEQAITNVLNNAVKFTPRGGSVTVSCSQDSDTYAVVTVTDSGAGITPEEMARIFEPYYQSERTRGGNSGLGIGLRLVQEIMRLHGGSIEAESQGPSLGSTFTLTIPLVASTGQVEAKTESHGEETADSKQILIIDDNKAAADALVRLFTALKYSATAHYSGKDAFLHIDERPVDIIFADIGMPEMNGYEFVKVLRENGYTNVPVVALTGYGLEEDRAKALAAGFDEHLTKPVGAEDLQKMIASLTTV